MSQKPASEWAEKDLQIQIEDGVSTISWKIAIDTDNPRYVEMEVSSEDEEALRRQARLAYYDSEDHGVSPIKSFKQKYWPPEDQEK